MTPLACVISSKAGCSMFVAPRLPPLKFDASEEQAESGEDKIAQELIQTMRSIQETVLENRGHAQRSVHAKSWGIFEGEMQVFDDLSDTYSQGLFATAGATYPVIMRVSSMPGDILDDDVTAPHGLGVKVLDVEGERLPGSEADSTQDFVLVNGPYFQAPNAKVFLTNLKLLAATTDKAEPMKKAASAMNRALESALEAFGGGSANLKAMGGAPMTHPLGDIFYSQTAFRYGDYVAKFSIAPVSEHLVALSEERVDVKGKPDGFRQLVADHIHRYGGEWDVRVQLRTDEKHMPIEDPSKEWSQDDSPYVPVARIKVEPQPGWSEARAKAVDDQLSFSVWHGLAAHQPLGSVNRVRKPNYEAAAQFRGNANGCPIHEPQSWSGMPD
jgi:hypothetical protein